MRAFAIDAFNTPGAIHDLPSPLIGAHEILVRVRAAGVNPADWKTRDNLVPTPDAHFPMILGQDMAGVVERVGAEVSGFAAGDAVFGLIRHVGTYAEEIAAPTTVAVAHKPSTLDFAHAAALPTPGLTAVACVAAVDIHADETLLVVGASGGVGRYVVQLAVRRGARVITTARDTASATELRQLGASEMIDYTRTDLATAVRAARPAGVDAIIDLASNRAALTRLAGALRNGGRLASTTYAADAAAVASRGIQAANVNLTRSGIETASQLDELARLADAGQLVVPVDRTFPLAAAAQALDGNKSGAVRGKIVLTID